MSATEYVEKDLQVGDLSLHYQEWGDDSNPPVVMLHGFALSGHMYDEFASRLKDRYHLFAIDQRGHGDSGHDDGGDYTREAFVRDLEGFAAGVGLDRFILAGHSMGGLNAVSYAARHPDQVRALVLIDVGPEAAREGVENIVQFTRLPDEVDFEEYVKRTHQYNPRRTEENIRERLGHRLKPTESGKYTWKFDRRLRDKDSGVRVGSELNSDDMWAMFRKVHVPTLLVRGAESDILKADTAERTVAEMPNARLAVVPAAGHSVPGDNPDEFTAVVETFLREVDNGGAAEGNGTPDIEAAVDGQVRSSRRRSLLVLVGIGAAAAVGLAVAGFLFDRRRKRKTRRAQAAQLRDRVPASRDEIDAARQRALALASEFGKLGQARARQAAAGARDRAGTPDLAGSGRAALDILRTLERHAVAAPRTARKRLQSEQRRQRRRRVAHLQRKPGIAERALGVALRAADMGAETEQKLERKASRWSQWRPSR